MSELLKDEAKVDRLEKLLHQLSNVRAEYEEQRAIGLAESVQKPCAPLEEMAENFNLDELEDELKNILKENAAPAQHPRYKQRLKTSINYSIEMEKEKRHALLKGMTALWPFTAKTIAHGLLITGIFSPIPIGAVVFYSLSASGVKYSPAPFVARVVTGFLGGVVGVFSTGAIACVTQAGNFMNIVEPETRI